MRLLVCIVLRVRQPLVGPECSLTMWLPDISSSCILAFVIMASIRIAIRWCDPLDGTPNMKDEKMTWHNKSKRESVITVCVALWVFLQSAVCWLFCPSSWRCNVCQESCPHSASCCICGRIVAKCKGAASTYKPCSSIWIGQYFTVGRGTPHDLQRFKGLCYTRRDEWPIPRSIITGEQHNIILFLTSSSYPGGSTDLVLPMLMTRIIVNNKSWMFMLMLVLFLCYQCFCFFMSRETSWLLEASGIYHMV